MFKLFRYKKIYIFLLISSLVLTSFNTLTSADRADRPDLIIDSVIIPSYITEGKTVEFVVKIKNIPDPITGEKANISAGTNIVVALIIDYTLVATNNTLTGLNIGETKFVNLSWTAELGSQTQRRFSIEVDYPQIIDESNENNNFWDGFINVYEKGPVLNILSINVTEKITINKQTTVIANIKNYGGETNSTIYAKLNSSIDGEIQTLTKTSSLKRNGSYDFSFKWTPKNFGTHKLSVDLIYKGLTHDFKEKLVIIEIGQLQWWDENWHYRYFLSVNGTGNIEKNLNFTNLLNNLDIYSEIFENDTIRIVQYLTNGSYIDQIYDYKFIKGPGFDPAQNAYGTLIWNVTSPIFEKFYCIYFDVIDNIGTRLSIPENPDLIASGNATLGYFSYHQGWWIDSLKPINGSYSLITNPINIHVTTTAKAKSVSAFIFNIENGSHNFLLDLENVGDNTIWSYDDFYFDLEGNWTIIINAEDWVGYNPYEIVHSFFVGKPDLILSSIDISTVRDPNSQKIYLDDTVNITAKIICQDATIQNVEISIIIYDISEKKIVFNDIIITTIVKNINNLVHFNWIANKSGDFNITITVDPENKIDEQNENNNQLIKKITVSQWPDLAVIDIFLPSVTVIQFDSVKIDALIKNLGSGDADNYEVGLYIEPESQGLMKYSDKKDQAFVSINSNSSKTVSLYWDSARPGKWFVGVMVLYNSTKKDTNISNNRMLSDKILEVRSIETNPPIISNLQIIPLNQIQGGTVTISATIKDESELESVTIKIINPVNVSYTENMLRSTGDLFRYRFQDTNLIGKYYFEITAVDFSKNKNQAAINQTFDITADKTIPVITYFVAEPRVQLVNGFVEILCIAKDDGRIKKVTAVIQPPTGSLYDVDLTSVSENEYIFNDSYEIIGRYVYFVKVEDYAGNIVSSESKIFWITNDLNDTDSDGMPDWWEKQYNLDPEDPTDAHLDNDNDGFTNLEEYRHGTNPNKDIFSENAVVRLKQNIGYLSGSIVAFIFVVLSTVFMIWRKKE